MALPRGALGLSAVCDCGISRSYALTIFVHAGIEKVLFYEVQLTFDKVFFLQMRGERESKYH